MLVYMWGVNEVFSEKERPWNRDRKQGARAAQTSEEEAQQHMQRSCLRQESLVCL